MALPLARRYRRAYRNERAQCVSLNKGENADRRSRDGRGRFENNHLPRQLCLRAGVEN